MTPDEMIKKTILARNIELGYDLDAMTNKQLLLLQQSVDNAREEALAYIKDKTKKGAWTRERSYKIVNEMDRLTLGTQKAVGNSIAEISASTSKYALSETNDILSFNGKVPGFNTVSLSANQIKEFVMSTPIGGRLLSSPVEKVIGGKKTIVEGWVQRTFNEKAQREIQREILTGAFKGESYLQLNKRLTTAFKDIGERELMTLTRTYVHSANVNAMDRVYKANADLLVGVRWSAVLESGYKKSGRGTCIQCAALDGNIYAE